MLGVAYRVAPQVMLRGAVSAMFANPQAKGFGGGIGINVGF